MTYVLVLNKSERELITECLEWAFDNGNKDFSNRAARLLAKIEAS